MKHKSGAPIGAPSFLDFVRSNESGRHDGVTKRSDSPALSAATRRLAAAAIVVAAIVVVVVVAAAAAAVAEDQQQDDDPPPVVTAEAAADTIIIAHKITSDYFRWALLPTLHVMTGGKKSAATGSGRREYFTEHAVRPPGQSCPRSFRPSS